MICKNNPAESVEVCFNSEPSLIKSLTSREREVLVFLANGYSAREVSQAIGIAMSTACAHRASIYKKMNIHTVAEASKIAIRSGLVDL